MKIAIDFSQLGPEKTGIEYYTYELTKALIKADPETNFLLVSNNENYLNVFKGIQNVELKVFESDKINFLWIFKLGLWLRRQNVNALISPSNLMLNFWFPRTIQIIHDIVPVTNPEYWPRDSIKKFKLQLNIASRFVKKVGTISETTKKELIKHYPGLKKKTECIGIGLHEWTLNEVNNIDELRIKNKYSLPEKYILSVSTLQPRKNYTGMIRAFDLFSKNNPEYKYLIVGKKGWLYDSIFSLVQDLKLEDKVIFLGYVPEEDLPTIYDNSSALLFLSLAEGFGLPAIEAYSRGIPSVMNDIEVFRESMEGLAYFVKHDKPEDVTLALSKAVKSKIQINKNFLEKYSWEKVANNLKSLYSNFV